MSALPGPELISEIDARQGEVLRKLDELNGRIERAILTFAGPSPSPHAPPLPALLEPPSSDAAGHLSGLPAECGS